MKVSFVRAMVKNHGTKAPHIVASREEVLEALNAGFRGRVYRQGAVEMVMLWGLQLVEDGEVLWQCPPERNIVFLVEEGKVGLLSDPNAPMQVGHWLGMLLDQVNDPPPKAE